MNFPESEAYLFSLGNEVETMKLGLENIRKLLAALGNPQNSFVKVQVAGTNGKGSVCGFLDSICLLAGIKTGVFTSPHLVSMTERVRVEGVDIGEEEFARLATRVREISELLVERGEIETVPTYFEQVTAIGLVAFAEAKVDLAVLETGLGGRYDAVTAANAEIAAIARIDLDHQQYLGDTIEKIADEKAAIIHKVSRVVVGKQQPNPLKVLLDRCASVRAVARMTCEPTLIATTPTGASVVEFHTTRNEHLNATLGLLGGHQTENACIAILVAELLVEVFKFAISNEHIRLGLEDARHPGRLEWSGNLLLDGAHNVGGAKALAAYLNEFVSRPVTMIFGGMKDKNVLEMADILWPKAERIILTRADNPRSIPAAELARFKPQSVDGENIVLAQSVREALDKTKGLQSDGSIILVTGSLYLVGEVKRLRDQNSQFEI